MNADVQQLTRERYRLRLLIEVTNAVVAHLELRALLHAINETPNRQSGNVYPSVIPLPDCPSAFNQQFSVWNLEKRASHFKVLN